MASFRFKNKYDHDILFEFNATNMKIQEEGINTIIYIFNYNDIKDYSIVPNRNQYYTLYFYANGKKIQKIENGEVKYTDFVIVTVFTEMKDSVLKYTKYVSDPSKDIGLIIYNNTPLRSPIDKIRETGQEIRDAYKNTSDGQFGTIYLRVAGRNLTEYKITLNNVPLFVMHNDNRQEILKQSEEYNEPLAKPYWLDNKTIAFKVPYGKWEVNYSHYDYYNEYSMTCYQEGIIVEVNDSNKEFKIKKKMGLFSNKLIQYK